MIVIPTSAHAALITVSDDPADAADFTSIATAVDSASSGDVIEVYYGDDGVYTGANLSTMATMGDITLRAHAWDVVTIHGGSSPAIRNTNPFSGNIAIENLILTSNSSSASLTLNDITGGFRLSGADVANNVGTCIELQNIAGVVLVDSASTVGFGGGCGDSGVDIAVSIPVITTAVIHPATIDASGSAVSLDADSSSTPAVLDVSINTDIQSAGNTAIRADAGQDVELSLRVAHTTIDGYPSSSLAVDVYCIESSACAISVADTEIGNAGVARGGVRFRSRSDARLDLRFVDNTLVNIANSGSTTAAIWLGTVINSLVNGERTEFTAFVSGNSIVGCLVDGLRVYADSDNDDTAFLGLTATDNSFADTNAVGGTASIHVTSDDVEVHTDFRANTVTLESGSPIAYGWAFLAESSPPSIIGIETDDALCLGGTADGFCDIGEDCTSCPLDCDGHPTFGSCVPTVLSLHNGWTTPAVNIGGTVEVTAAGELATSLPLNLGDRIWDDNNNDGIQNDPSGEPGIRLHLDGTDRWTTTDEEGYYELVSLRPGLHTVSMVVPPGRVESPALQGTDAAIDSNCSGGAFAVDITTSDSTSDCGLQNSPVAALGIAGQSIDQGQPYVFTIPEWPETNPAFYDPDGDELTYSITDSPSWLIFDGDRTLSGIPVDQSAVAIHSVTVRATDDAAEWAETDFALEVLDVNLAPRRTSSDISDSSTPHYVLPTRFAYRYDFESESGGPVFLDPDDDALDYVAFQDTTCMGNSDCLSLGVDCDPTATPITGYCELPAWLDFPTGTGSQTEKRTFSGIPLVSDIGTYGIVVFATDAEFFCASGATFSLEVTAETIEPVFWDGFEVGDSSAWSATIPPPLRPPVIDEIMQNPSAVSDLDGEWFEIHNPNPVPIDIENWTITDNDTDHHLIHIGGLFEIPAGGFLVFGIQGDEFVNGGVMVDYVYTGITLANTDDELILLDTSLREIDRVEWDDGSTFPDPNGASMSLADPALDNSVGTNWCASTSPFGDGDLGTPGAANDACAK